MYFTAVTIGIYKKFPICVPSKDAMSLTIKIITFSITYKDRGKIRSNHFEILVKNLMAPVVDFAEIDHVMAMVQFPKNEIEQVF